MDGINPSSCAILLDNWISNFDSKRFFFTVCTLKNPDPSGALLERKGVKVHYFGYGKFSLKNIDGLMKLIAQHEADILHLHGYSAANFGRIAARRKGIINIVHEHAVLKILPHQYLADLFLRPYTDTAVAVSENVKDFMIKARSIPAWKIRTIWNGVRIDKFRKGNWGNIQTKRSELGIPESFKVIGTVTRLREEKGNEYFIRAIPATLREFPNLIFIIAGDGPLREKLEKLARHLNISDNLKFLGFRSDVVDLLSIFDITIIASLSEGFPLSLVEAMSIGNPIITTRVGGMKEVALDHETVLFVPPKNPTEITNKLVYLIKNPSMANKLSIQAKEASKKFSIQRNARCLEDLYLELYRKKGILRKPI
jgi:glycosyltransferase involved in cell wall biosynthesis